MALFSLVLIIWLWVFPKPQAFADVIVILAEIAIITLGVLGMFLWLRLASAISFNTSMLGGYAYYLGFGLLAIGILLLLVASTKIMGVWFLDAAHYS